MPIPKPLPKGQGVPDLDSPHHLAALLTERVTFPFDGKEWPLVFTYRTLLMSQELTGGNLLEENLAEPTAALTRALLYSALSLAGAPCSLTDIGKLIWTKGLTPTVMSIKQAWSASMPEPEERPSDEDEVVDRKLEWVTLWASAREIYHLSADEWLNMTPRMFSALQKARLEEIQREELLYGLVCATSANYSFCRPDKMLSPEHFMFHRLPEPPLKPLTGEMIMAEVRKLKGL